MTTNALLDAPLSRATSADRIEGVILKHLDEQAVIGLDALIVLMPEYSWNQIFHAIDRLARCGQITLRRHRSEYTIFASHYAA